MNSKCIFSVFLVVSLFCGIGAPEGQAQSFPSMITVPDGFFRMGRPSTDTGSQDEIPRHYVSLDRYQIGKYPVTNDEFVTVLNWAHAHHLLKNADGTDYTGGGIYAYGQAVASTASDTEESQIIFENNQFSVRSREGHGGELFSMADHPVVHVSWYGAVCYCNWLSAMKNLDPCYNIWQWKYFEPMPNGYRLPTEAEWERAAAWDGSKHWRYGMSSDSIDFTNANFVIGDLAANPLGLKSRPYTSPVGWYDGMNLARLDMPGVPTVNARSPMGTYDMSGNVWEWCYDWYSATYYTKNSMENPRGPASGDSRVLRGGSWLNYDTECRTARREKIQPYMSFYSIGFRISRTPGEFAEGEEIEGEEIEGEEIEGEEIEGEEIEGEEIEGEEIEGEEIEGEEIEGEALLLKHPADRNGDWRIDSDEAELFLKDWQQGQEEMTTAIRALYIMNSGESYSYVSDLDPPLCWMPED